MFLPILLTFVITSLSLMVLVMRRALKENYAEKKNLRRENEGLRRQITDYREMERDRREQNAYDRGLYDGRTTDKLYRSLISKYKKGDRITLMCNGKEVTEDYE